MPGKRKRRIEGAREGDTKKELLVALAGFFCLQSSLGAKPWGAEKLFDWAFHPDSDFDETGRQLALKDELEMGGLRAGNSYEFFQLVNPDDIVSAKRKTKSVYEKTGRSGRLLFWEVETSYSNQRNELLATNVETMFLRL